MNSSTAVNSAVVVKNECSRDKIEPRFEPLIAVAIATYKSVFGVALLNVRLMGSVARGEAGPHSDIDFIAVLDAEPGEDQLLRLKQCEVELRHAHPQVARVDLEAVPRKGLHPFRQFVFATDSLSVFGTDNYSGHSQTWDRQALALLVTPDLAGIVESYTDAVSNSAVNDAERLRFFSRIIGKDILKCCRRTALLRGAAYERSIGKIYRQLLEYMPEQSALLHELHDLYQQPSSDRARLLRALEQAAAEVKEQ
jgi:predicted nucleotidyltransferase